MPALAAEQLVNGVVDFPRGRVDVAVVAKVLGHHFQRLAFVVVSGVEAAVESVFCEQLHARAPFWALSKSASASAHDLPVSRIHRLHVRRFVRLAGGRQSICVRLQMRELV